MEFIRELGAWNWFILGLILIGLELLVPGAFLLWFGVAAIATGIVVLVTDLSWQVEVLIFVVFAIASVFVARRFSPGEKVASDSPFLNRRAEALVGRVFVLEEAIQAGNGRARVEDSLWRVKGPDMPVGARVRVERVEGTTLVVSPES
jgi:membrane protein implicated in regulation of membrane protease activity